MATKVIFRKWANGDAIAMFPEIPASNDCRYCQSYGHIGQHGGADPVIVLCGTTPATPDEYTELLQELVTLGYDDLEIRRRITPAMTLARSRDDAGAHACGIGSYRI